MPLIDLHTPYATWRGKDQTRNGNVLYPVAGRTLSRRNELPANPRSALQIFARNSLSVASRAFAALTPVEVQSWIDQAASFTRLDVNGKAYQPGAKAYFVAVNWYRALAGLPIVNIAPPTSGPVAAVANPALTLHGAANDFALDCASADGIVVLEASAPLPGNQRKAQFSEYRLINTADLTANIRSAIVGTLTFSAAGAARRFTYQSGDRVGLRVTLLTADHVRQTSRNFEVMAAG